MNLRVTTTWIGALAIAFMLAFTSCSQPEFPGADLETPDYLTAQGEELNADLLVFPISGHGFRMEIRQDPGTPDQVTMMFFSGSDLLSVVDWKILIEVQQILANDVEVKLTVKDQQWGDMIEYPAIGKNIRGHSVVGLDLSPDKFDLDPNYSLKFILEIDNRGSILEPANLIYKMTGGHIMAENVDGRQLYMAPAPSNGILNGQGTGGQQGNIIGDTGEVGPGGAHNEETGGTSVIDGGDHEVDAPIRNGHGGHIMVENVDGRQMMQVPVRLND